MYCSRKWLNKNKKPSTGSVVAYYGLSDWSEKEVAFFEISDCHCKVRLHKTTNDSMGDFIFKLNRLAEEAKKFALYLEDKE